MREEPPKCECDCEGCRDFPGPAAYIVEREGKKMKVCTRCDLSSDKRLEIIAKPYNPEIYMDYDGLGAFVLTIRIGEENSQRKATQN